MPTAPDTEIHSPSPSVPWRDRAARLFLYLVGSPTVPLVVGVLLVASAGYVGLRSLGVPLPTLGRPSVVVFDPVRFLNAQRAAASLMAMSPSANTAFTLTQVAKQAEATIQDEAHGALVLVRQSVVVPGDIPDITDAVLRRFGLPTDVPTVHTSGGELVDVAPTDNAFGAGKGREDYRLELQQRTQQIMAEDGKRATQANMVP